MAGVDGGVGLGGGGDGGMGNCDSGCEVRGVETDCFS